MSIKQYLEEHFEHLELQLIGFIIDIHFYGMYKAKLLVAITYDENNEVYSLCFIIEEETNCD
jgi:hypothetical protein